MKRFYLFAAGLLTVLAACGGTAAPATSVPASSPAAAAVSPSASAAASAGASGASASARPASSAAAASASSAAASTSASSSSAATGAASASGSAAAKPAASGAAGSDAPLNPPVKVVWGVSGLAPEAGIYIAKERGYFQAQGLDVDLQVFRSFTDQIGLLGTGKLDYGTGGLNVDLFNAVQRGIPLKIVVANAVGTKGDASSALLVRQDLVDSGRYKDFKDLKGMSIAENSSGTSSQMITEKILAMGGLTKADVTFPTVSFPDMATAFANKAIDAAFDVEPFVNGIVSKHLAKSVIAVGDAFPNSVNQVVVISPQFAQQQPEAARRIMVAFLKGQREYYAAFLGNTNPGDRDAIIQILTKYTALKDPKLYQGMGMSGADPNGDGVDLKIVGEFQDYFIKAGTEKQPIDPAQLVDPSYMNYAVQKLGKV